MTTTPMMILSSSSSTASFSSFSKSRKKQLLICPATTIMLRRNSKAFLIRATANGSNSKGKRMINSDVLMVDPLEAKQMAVKQMQEIQSKERFKKLRRIEAINGAWAVIGLMVGLIWFRSWIERLRSLHLGGEAAEMGKNRKIGIFDEEIELKRAEEKENTTGCGVSPQVVQMDPILVVGYALTMKKVKSFLQPKFEMLARKKGILFVKIDTNMCLSEQGPFHIILHKLLQKKWLQDLEDYREHHPNVVVLDPPEGIQRVHNRLSMLKDVADLKFSDCCGKVGVPRQLVINKDPSSIPDVVTKAGLTLPLVAKPLMVDGSAKSHALSLVYNLSSLSKLDPPLVLQEFINHGGILFKTYIVGEAIKVVRRFSLPDLEQHDIRNHSGVFNFPRVSCAAASADDADLSPSIAEFPPGPLLERFARELRHRLGLRIFNMDIIRERGTTDKYYVIDINYFPGFGKLPGYEQLFTDFLLGFIQTKQS